jgi:hypothetical protein
MSNHKPVFQATPFAILSKCRGSMHIALARPLLPSQEVMHSRG